MTLICISTINNCYNSFRRRYNDDASCATGFVGTVIAILHLIKAIHMVATGSVEPTEIVIMILSVMIVCIHYAYNDTHRDLMVSLSYRKLQS